MRQDPFTMTAPTGRLIARVTSPTQITITGQSPNRDTEADLAVTAAEARDLAGWLDDPTPPTWALPGPSGTLTLEHGQTATVFRIDRDRPVWAGRFPPEATARFATWLRAAAVDEPVEQAPRPLPDPETTWTPNLKEVSLPPDAALGVLSDTAIKAAAGSSAHRVTINGVSVVLVSERTWSTVTDIVIAHRSCPT